MSTALFTTVARGGASGIRRAQRLVVRGQAEWEALWTAHAGADAPVPPIDFSTQMVAAIFAGEEGAHQTVAIESIVARQDALTFLVAAAPAAAVAGAFPAPFHIVALARTDLPVAFADRPAPRVYRAVTGGPHRPSSTGLTPQTAGALAYLAGPVSGLLMLGIEQTSRFVRFHAWQAVLVLGGLGLAAAGSLLLAFLFLVVSPTAFRIMLWLAMFSAIAWVVIWAACLVRAYQGHRWKLPLAGDYAERWASTGRSAPR